MLKTLVLIILILSNSLVFGQNHQFGIKIEPQLNWFSVSAENCFGSESQPGVNIGLVLDRVISDNYYFHTGIGITLTGGGITCSDTFHFISNSTEHTFFPENQQQYLIQNLHVPVGLKFKTGGRKFYTYYGEIGTDFMIRIHGNLVSKDYEAIKYNVSDELNAFNFGYHVGGGMEFLLNDRSFLQVGVAFSQGLIDILNDDKIKIIQNMANLRLAVYF